MSDRRLVLVQPKDVPTIWHIVKPMIDKSILDEWMTVDEILKDILSKKNHLFVGIDGEQKIHMALVTEFVEYPNSKTLYINTWATGTGYDFNIWYPFITVVDDFGRENGCTTIEATVRKGLARKLKWKYQYSVCTRSLKQNGKEEKQEPRR